MQKMSDRLFAKKGGNWDTFSSGSLPAFIKKARSGLLCCDSNRNYYFWINRRLLFHVRFSEGFDSLGHSPCVKGIGCFVHYNEESVMFVMLTVMYSLKAKVALLPPFVHYQLNAILFPFQHFLEPFHIPH